MVVETLGLTFENQIAVYCVSAIQINLKIQHDIIKLNNLELNMSGVDQQTAAKI